MGPSDTPTQKVHDAVPLPAQSMLLAHALSQTCVPIPARGRLLQPPAPPSGPKELGMKGDSGRQHLIPASGESSFPGLGWGRRVRNREGTQARRCGGVRWEQRLPVTDAALPGLEQEAEVESTCRMSKYSSYKSS